MIEGHVKTILIVDDSSTLRQLTRAPLESAGHRVVEAADGVDALTVLKRESVDLIVVDINMPRMNGVEFIKHARDLARYKTTPIFVVTTESSQAMLAAGKEAGATAWIVKPFKPDALLSGIAMALQPSPATL
jgi:two-component system chemotaxis response regulator CheY